MKYSTQHTKSISQGNQTTNRPTSPLLERFEPLCKTHGILHILKNIFALSWIYLVWIVIHYLAAYAYTWWCTPNTLLGFLTSPFLATSPHCEALRWCITQGALNFKNMWLVLGTWFVAKLTI